MSIFFPKEKLLEHWFTQIVKGSPL